MCPPRMNWFKHEPFLWCSSVIANGVFVVTDGRVETVGRTNSAFVAALSAPFQEPAPRSPCNAPPSFHANSHFHNLYFNMDCSFELTAFLHWAYPADPVLNQLSRSSPEAHGTSLWVSSALPLPFMGFQHLCVSFQFPSQTRFPFSLLSSSLPAATHFLDCGPCDHCSFTVASAGTTCSLPNLVDSFFYFFLFWTIFSPQLIGTQALFKALCSWDHRLCFPVVNLDYLTHGLGFSRPWHGVMATPLSFSTAKTEGYKCL